jgi:hypothetical protein
MSANAFDDIGSRDVPGPYQETGAWWRDCVSCGALAGHKCRFQGFKGVTLKAHPCWKRYVGRSA